MPIHRLPTACRILAAGLTVFAMSTTARAQDSSLLGETSAGQARTLEQASFLYQQLPPAMQNRELAKHDHVTVLVDYRSSMTSEGEAQSRKNASINAALTEWIGFDGKSIFKAPQSRGDPRVAGSLNSQYRANSEIELDDALTFRITAEVVDIQPNGNLVIEAHRSITINDEVWQQSLTGVVSRQFINADRTVRSENIASLKIDKREEGQVRDGYAAGWMNRWWGKYKPF